MSSSDHDRLKYLVTSPNHITATDNFTQFEARTIAMMASCFPVDDCIEATGIWEPTAAQYREAQQLWKKGRLMAIFVARRILADHDPWGYFLWVNAQDSSDIKPKLEAVK